MRKSRKDAFLILLSLCFSWRYVNFMDDSADTGIGCSGSPANKPEAGETGKAGIYPGIVEKRQGESLHHRQLSSIIDII